MGFFMSTFPIIFIISFAIILGTGILLIIVSAKNYHRNATSPILSQHARIVSKRTEVMGNSSMNDNHTHNSTHTRYYVTFETDAGQRIELILSGKEYGLLAEGDIGLLTYQGEWYKKFEREIFRE